VRKIKKIKGISLSLTHSRSRHSFPPPPRGLFSPFLSPATRPSPRPTLEQPASRSRLPSAAAADRADPRPWDTDKWDPAVKAVPYLVSGQDSSPNPTGRARNRPRRLAPHGCPFKYSSRPSPSPYLNLSANRRIDFSEKLR
jgi:hypothetical protein